MGYGWMVSINDTNKLRDREAFGQFLSTHGLDKNIKSFYFIDHFRDGDMQKTFDTLLSSFPELRFEEYRNEGPSPQMMMGNRSTSNGSVSKYRKHNGI